MEPKAPPIPKAASYPETLTKYELPWLARYEFLKEHGYLLRPRYRPGWTPSWKTNSRLTPIFCEDWTMISHKSLLDAQRISDGVVVMLKVVDEASIEGQITIFFSSEFLRNDPRNHAVPVLDILEDNVDGKNLLLVLPLLRDIRSPKLESIPEALDMIQQTLEGLAFLHANQVAHGTCSADNILMDARGCFPDMWHPQCPIFTPQFRLITKEGSRTRAGGVRYYFIDFGCSTRGKDRTAAWYGDEHPPELSPIIPDDDYRFDIYVLGRVYQKILLDEFINVDFLQPLIDRMTSLNPVDYLSAVGAYAMFKDIRASLNIGWFNQRLRKRESRLVARILMESSYWLQLQLTRLSPKPVLPPLQ